MAKMKDEAIIEANLRHWETGAKREKSTGKGRCDLLPLDVVAKLMHSVEAKDILGWIDAYMWTGDTDNIKLAVLEFTDINYKHLYTERPNDCELADAMLDVSKRFEMGASKYNPRNWEAGIPISVYIDSGVRHYLKYLRGDDDEPHGQAFLWNMLCLVWTHHHKPECIDLPEREAK